uniref:Acetyl-coenzyme A carboxylase carboxyl transferase subunit beta, chloroplastic n=1 Tax=Mucuna sempervirens TaxID=690556 RepID=A0A8E7UDR8_9FABA|nr:acetyl-CoA carboxylase carboxyltransferase beta subunit [Mucuna sempervirens]
MKKWWFNSMLFNRKLEYRCELSKSIDSLGPIENTSVSEEDPKILTDMNKKIHSCNDTDNSSYSYFDYLVGVRNIQNFLSDKTFLVRDNKRNSYSIYLDIENKTLEIDNDHPFLSEQESFFSSYLNNVSKSDDDHYMYDTKYSWNNKINSCIDSYLHSQICIDSFILDDSDKYNDSYFYSYFFGKSRNSSESENSSSSIITSTNDRNDSDSTIGESSNNLDETQKYKHLWIECENCYGLNYKKFLKSKMNICEHCGYHLKMSSSDRIELSIDPGTWNPMDEDMVSLDPIEFHSEEEPYEDRIDSYQRKTGLTEAVQTGTGQLNGIPVAIGIMDFQFMGGSMGSAVGEKITRLVEYATNQLLPLILVCASGGARMQEGSLSLMQMAKISSALYDYQTNKKLFYVSILTSPTTGGVTASFGMLGDIIIAEPNAYIAFAGKRVIEQTLNKPIPEGSQAAEYLFHKGLFDSIVPRHFLKGVLSELFQFHNFFSLTKNEKKAFSAMPSFFFSFLVKEKKL